MIALLFWTLTLSACGYAALCGGRDGLSAAGLIVVASLLTIPAAQPDLTWGSFQVGLFLVDSAFLLGLYIFVLRSRRWWPIWMAGFHLLAVTAHAGAWISDDFLPDIYFAAASFSALPVPVFMVIGIMLDRRAGVTSQDRTARHETAVRWRPLRGQGGAPPGSGDDRGDSAATARRTRRE